jgi:site-specific DNA-adenine methylase
MVNLRPFFSYYGGKHRSVATYPAPLYPDVIEVFAGSAGYATRYADRRVVLVDNNPQSSAPSGAI